MADQYWIGGFFIDLSRNKITQNNRSQTIPPKALAVLTHLAENQGKVVSHDALLASVWPNTIVSPNTLQRSIAQLRKALGDDGKVQVYIKTHAKQGYSLECDVRWQDNFASPVAETPSENTLVKNDIDETNSGIGSVKKPPYSRFTMPVVLIVVAIIALGALGYQYHNTRQAPQLVIHNIRSLTATDDKEFDASYSPDGKYIVFHRYLDQQCTNKLWAKDLDTRQEIQLTKDWGTYGRHSFSKDGKSLIFLATKACDEPVTQTSCYDLVSLDFQKALESPQDTSLMLQCKNSKLKKPNWLSEDNIALLKKESNHWKLINYSVSSNTSTDIYDLNEGNLVDYAYSMADELIAVISIRNDSRYYLEMLKPNGRIVSSHPIERPQEIPKFVKFYPTFDPGNRQLIFSTGKQLFSLSYKGKIAKISLPLADRLMQPEFHPDGKRLLMIKGPYDYDIVLLPLSEIAKINSSTQTITERPEQFGGEQHGYESFERSNLGEDYAVFQPGGELIAFWSERSGDEQLWVSDGNGSRQLTNFPLDTFVGDIAWAADGRSLLINVDGILTHVTLDSNKKSFQWKHAVVMLFHWNSENNSALLLARIKGVLKFVEVKLDRANSNVSSFREVNDKIVVWASRSEDGRLIYKDQLGQFWQPGPVEDERIDILDKQGGKAKSFLIKGNVVYAINKENQLWSYDLNTETFKVLGTVREEVSSLTDINQTHALMTVQVSSKQEVVELSLSE